MCQSKQDFVHLHAHTDISVQDALPKPKAYAMKAREMGFPAAAITDHGRMGGCIEFADACRSPHDTLAPIKPLLGCEVYTTPNRHIKEMTVRADGSKTRDHRHLTLLAMNATGYKNLLNIASIGAEEGFYYDPRVDWEVISKHNEGIIALSGCLGSETSRAFLRGDDDEAENVMRRFKETFGDRYYAELQYHGIPEQKMILPKLASLASKLDIPCIASNDVHYLDAQDWQVHDILIQMRSLKDNGAGKKNGKKEAYGSHQFYLKTQQEMLKIFSSKPEAVRNTVELADRIEDFLKLDVPHLLPEVKIPTEDPRFRDFWQRHLPYHKPKEAYLSYLAFSGLKELGHDQDKSYVVRLRHELNNIIYQGVVDYFLIQSEMVGFMKSSDILYGIRGSGVGSLVLHCLQVCPVDPMRWNLLFERFLNPGRGTQYKIDLSCYPAKDWLADNPGVDQTSAVRRLKALVKEQASSHPEHGPEMAKELWVLENQGLAAYLCDLADKGYGTSYNECQLWTAHFLRITDEAPESGMLVSKVATLPDVDTDIDDRKRGDVIEWARRRFGKDHVAMIGTKGTYQAKAAVLGSLKVSADFQKRWGDKTHIMAQVISKTIPTRQQPPMTIEDAIEESEDFAVYARQYPAEIAIAKRLVGTISHLGTHAGGVLVSSQPIRDVAPLENNKGVLASAYDMSAVERVGLVKYDYLGLATYQMISRALAFIEKSRGASIDLTKIDLTDPKVLRLYGQGKTDSIFQFASAGMKKWLKELQPDSVEELIAMNALFRPGPLDYIQNYIDGKRNPHKVKYSHPVLEKILSSTYGIPVYQEQLMALFREMAGFSWQEVDKVRKAVSKKQGAEFDKACRNLADRAIANGFSQEVVNEVLGLIATFGGYAFNKSHACSYSLLSFSTAYLRCYYPAEWLAACMQIDRDDEDKMALYRRECKSEGITVIRPNINESGMETTVTARGGIALPLTAIKGVGAMAQAIVDAQPFTDVMDLAVRARPNSGMLRAFADAGALDCFSEMSALSGADEIMEYYEAVANLRNSDEKRRQKEARQKYKVNSILDDNEDENEDSVARRPTRGPEPSHPSRTRPRAARANSLRNVLGDNLSLNELCDM